MSVGRHTLLATALALATSAAWGTTAIPAESMVSGIHDAMLKWVRQTNPNIREVRVKRYRIVSSTINGKTPLPQPYYDLANAVPYLNCDPKNPSSDRLTLETAHTQEVSFSQVQSNTIGASVEVSGQVGGVGATVAASFSATFETGRTSTTSKQETRAKEKNITVEPMQGMWIIPYGERYEYYNAPYQVELDVIAAEIGVPAPGKMLWVPLNLPTPLPRFMINGNVTAKVPRGDMGLASVIMTPEETKAACPASFDSIPVENAAARRPSAGTQAGAPAVGRAARPFVGVVPAAKRSQLRPPAMPKP